jgi:hypothetical protein
MCCHGLNNAASGPPSRSGRWCPDRAALADPVRRFLRRGTEVETVLAEISAVNAELLARRELS